MRGIVGRGTEGGRAGSEDSCASSSVEGLFILRPLHLLQPRVLHLLAAREVAHTSTGQHYESAEQGAVILLSLLLNSGLKTVFSSCEDIPKDRSTRYHLALAAENGDPMHEVCIPYKIPRAWEQG